MRSKPTAALALIIVGVVFLAKNFGWIGGDALGRWWPVILIVAGVGLLAVRYKNPARCKKSSASQPAP